MEQEFEEIEQKNGWNEVFQQIRSEAERLSDEYTIKDSRRKENRDLNRYRDVAPFDHSRIRLTRGCDYINASLVQVDEADRRYILTQGPLPTTIGHFWLMIWDHKSKAVLMLNGLVERGAVKCNQYWPQALGEVLPLEDVDLEVKLLSEEENKHFVVRKCLLTDVVSSQSREVFQFHYTSWPDFGLPESPASFLQFLFAVRSSASLDQSHCGPPIVHCSAGIGRSGTLCLVDSCLLLIEKHADSAKVNVKNILIEMRRCRMGLIQTPEQLRFSYQAIIAGMKLLRPMENGVADEAAAKLDAGLRERKRSLSEDGKAPDKSPKNNNSAQERERVREERKRKTEENIKRIKHKSKEIEERGRLKSKLVKYSIVGAAVILGAGLAYGYFFSGHTRSPDFAVSRGIPFQRSLQNLSSELHPA